MSNLDTRNLPGSLCSRIGLCKEALCRLVTVTENSRSWKQCFLEQHGQDSSDGCLLLIKNHVAVKYDPGIGEEGGIELPNTETNLGSSFLLPPPPLKQVEQREAASEIQGSSCLLQENGRNRSLFSLVGAT